MGDEMMQQGNGEIESSSGGGSKKWIWIALIIVALIIIGIFVFGFKGDDSSDSSGSEVDTVEGVNVISGDLNSQSGEVLIEGYIVEESEDEVVIGDVV